MQGRAAVLGSPIGHSRSPALHRAAYAALGLDWGYEAIECTEDDLVAVLAERSDWAGFSCTMPLKRAALAVAVDASAVARAVGAANTLLPVAGGWYADNTDVDGIVAAVRETGRTPATATVLGAGGTAQAAVAALPALGVAAGTVLVREPARAGEVVATGRAVGVDVRVDRLGPDAPALAADLVVSTLPAHAADSVAARIWRAGQIVLDVVYDPWPTALAAAAPPATVIGGLRVLLHQAARQVELMTGHRAPLAAMAAVIERAQP